MEYSWDFSELDPSCVYNLWLLSILNICVFFYARHVTSNFLIVFSSLAVLESRYLFSSYMIRGWLSESLLIDKTSIMNQKIIFGILAAQHSILSIWVYVRHASMATKPWAGVKSKSFVSHESPAVLESRYLFSSRSLYVLDKSMTIWSIVDKRMTIK